VNKPAPRCPREFPHLAPRFLGQQRRSFPFSAAGVGIAAGIAPLASSRSSSIAEVSRGRSLSRFLPAAARRPLAPHWQPLNKTSDCECVSLPQLRVRTSVGFRFFR
jgi:hypothetical protein